LHLTTELIVRDYQNLQSREIAFLEFEHPVREQRLRALGKYKVSSAIPTSTRRVEN
jgi:hypothetical protein